MAATTWIAAFGDVHGAWDAMYAYCQSCAPKTPGSHWAHVGLVLQCGDIGLFTASSALDRATMRFAVRDTSELGADAYLTGAHHVPIPTFFVRGNHEDFSLLPSAGHGQVGSVEGLHHLYKKPVSVEVGNIVVRIAGLGGIAARGRRAANEWVDEEFPGKYFTRDEVEALRDLSPESVDILICHDGPYGTSLRNTPDAGSQTIRDLVKRLRPRILVYGHYHDPPDPYHIGDTRCVCLNHPSSWRLPNREGGMGLINPETMEFVWGRPEPGPSLTGPV